MKYKLILGLLLLLAACQEANPGDHGEINSFNECIEAGNPIMESYPRQCKAGDEVFTEELSPGEIMPGAQHVCTDEEKAAEICTREYMPVCGSDGNTYSNGCTACSTGLDSYVSGTCDELETLGGQRDVNGCLVAAGYSFDDQVNACIRPWELDDSMKAVAKVAVQEAEMPQLTVIDIESLRCPGCFNVILQAPEGEPFTIELRP